MGSISAEIRARFHAGEVLNGKQICEEYGCSSSMLAVARQKMVEDGHKFRSSERLEGNRKFVDWQLVPPKSNGSKKAVSKVADVEVEEGSVNRNGSLPLPVLGQVVTVSLLAVSEQGVVSIGLRDGKRTWLVQLTGQS